MRVEMLDNIMERQGAVRRSLASISLMDNDDGIHLRNHFLVKGLNGDKNGEGAVLGMNLIGNANSVV